MMFFNIQHYWYTIGTDDNLKTIYAIKKMLAFKSNFTIASNLFIVLVLYSLVEIAFYVLGFMLCVLR